MRKLSLAFLFIGAILCGAARADDSSIFSGGSTQRGSDLKAWVDKMPLPVPSENAAGFSPHIALWEDPEIKSNFIALVGKDAFHKFETGWGSGEDKGSPSTTVVKAFDDLVAFSACDRTGACEKNVIVYISIKNKKVWLCWEENGDIWLAPGRPSRKLKDGACWVNDYSDFRRIYREQSALDTK